MKKKTNTTFQQLQLISTSRTNYRGSRRDAAQEDAEDMKMENQQK